MNATIVREALERCLDRRLTFAAFRSPGGPIQLWAQRTPEPGFVEAHLLNEAGHVFVIAPFFSQMGHVHIIRSEVDLEFDTRLSQPDLAPLDACIGGEQAEIPVPPGLSKDAYVKAIAAAKEEFANGRLKKVVLARTEEKTLDPRQLPELFLAAEAAYPEAFIALVHTPMHGTWIGASPERLLVAEHGRVTVDALAGTLPIKDAPQDAARWGVKEREEQDLVTRKILRNYELRGLQNINATGPVVKTVGQMAHLHTTITADATDADPMALILAVHPTPAVCGEPVLGSQNFILEHEPGRRTLYTGFWGPWRGNGRSELHVNIRCMQIFPDKAVIHVGAGITSGSIPEREWEETELKAGTWMRLIRALPATRIS